MAPSLVNVLDSKMFETTHATSLADGLNFQPGVRVENNCQNCGFQQVRINGLEGPYTQILVDSRPIFSALTGVYGLEQIPANMIERVEIMRGGGSALLVLRRLQVRSISLQRAFAQLSPDCPFADDDRRKSPGQ